jgi:competence protein ComEC
MIEDLWEPDNPKVAKIWEMASTAIAAQISTLPFLIPLATDFPVYFLPANLLIVPLASLLTGGAFALVLLSPVPWIRDVLGWGIEWITWVMNQIARVLSILPGVSIPIPIHEVWQAWILGCVILILFFVLHVFRKPKS